MHRESSPARIGRFVPALLVLVAATFAAAIAHIIIDLAGDVLLARDAYDNQAHASRFIAFDLATVGGFAVAWHLLSSALSQARGRGRSLRAAVDGIVAGSLPAFATRVTITALALLALMGSFDACLDRTHIDGFDDLFGGSIAIGACVTIAIGMSVAGAMFAALRWIAGAHRSIVAAVVALFATSVRLGSAVALRRYDHVFAWHHLATALARRAAKRGPPLLLA